jgi:hypothetical protein
VNITQKAAVARVAIDSRIRPPLVRLEERTLRGREYIQTPLEMGINSYLFCLRSLFCCANESLYGVRDRPGVVSDLQLQSMEVEL